MLPMAKVSLRYSLQAGWGGTRDRNPYCPFAPWDKAG